LRSLAESPPAVAICDIHMPGPTGLWLANQIRERSPHTAMVLATSDASVPPSESMRKGIVAYILKPFQRQAVLTAVAEAFRWWAAESGRELPALIPVVASAPSPEPTSEPAVNRPQPDIKRAGLHVSVPVAMGALLIVALIIAAILYWMNTRRAVILSQVASASGTIFVYDGAGNQLTQGSGFFITPDLFVTNHHVVNGGLRASIVAAGAAEYRVSGLAAVNRRRDLVLLRTSNPAPAHLALAASPPEIGDAIAVYGAPVGLKGTLSTGIVSTMREDAGELLQMTAPISHGSSGSPVVNEDGAVVGVVVSSNISGQGLNFAVPAAHVQELLNEAGEGRPLLVAARGAGDDRERHELIGAVRAVTITSAEPFAALRERLATEYAQTMPRQDAQARAERQAMLDSQTRLMFDREGRLVERVLGDDVTKIRYQYDERGRLRSETHTNGTAVTTTWTFIALGQNTIEAADSPSGRLRRITYLDDGRLLAEETRLGTHVFSIVRWRYDDVSWPSASGIQETPAREEHDALGNPTRRVYTDGSEVLFTHRLDARGNWVTREIVRRDARGDRTFVSIQQREISYWD